MSSLYWYKDNREKYNDVTTVVSTASRLVK